MSGYTIENISRSIGAQSETLRLLSDALASFDNNPIEFARSFSTVEIDSAHCPPGQYIYLGAVGTQVRRVENMIERLALACKIINLQVDMNRNLPEGDPIRRDNEDDIRNLVPAAQSLEREFNTVVNLCHFSGWNEEPPLDLVRQSKIAAFDAFNRLCETGPALKNAGSLSEDNPLQSLLQARITYAGLCGHSTDISLQYGHQLLAASAAIIKTEGYVHTASLFITQVVDIIAKAKEEHRFTVGFLNQIYTMCPDAMDTVNVKATQNVPAPLNFDFI